MSDRPDVPRLARKVFRLLNEGDFEGFMAMTTDDVEFTSMVAEAEGTHFHGPDGIRAWWDTVRGAFDEVKWELLDVRNEGEGGVGRVVVSGSLGGVPVSQEMWQAVKFRGEKARWWAFYRSEPEAVEAARRPG